MFLALSSPGAPELKSLKLEIRSSFSSTSDTASSIGFFILQGKKCVLGGPSPLGHGRAGQGELAGQGRCAAAHPQASSPVPRGTPSAQEAVREKREGEKPGDRLGRTALATEEGEELAAASHGISGSRPASPRPGSAPGGDAGKQGRARCTQLRLFCGLLSPSRGRGRMPSQTQEES